LRVSCFGSPPPGLIVPPPVFRRASGAGSADVRRPLSRRPFGRGRRP
jgi:hypothetical protein